MTAVLRTLSNSLLTGRAGRLRLLQITQAQKNPELFRDFQPTPKLRGPLFLHKGISNGTGEVRTWAHLLCFTWQHTQVRALQVCTPAIVPGPTEPWQNPSYCFYCEYWESEVQEKWSGLFQSNNAGNLCVGRVWKPWSPSCAFLHAVNPHPNQSDTPWADAGCTELLHGRHQLWSRQKKAF